MAPFMSQSPVYLLWCRQRSDISIYLVKMCIVMCNSRRCYFFSQHCYSSRFKKPQPQPALVLAWLVFMSCSLWFHLTKHRWLTESTPISNCDACHSFHSPEASNAKLCSVLLITRPCKCQSHFPYPLLISKEGNFPDYRSSYRWTTLNFPSLSLHIKPSGLCFVFAKHKSQVFARKSRIKSKVLNFEFRVLNKSFALF